MAKTSNIKRVLPLLRPYRWRLIIVLGITIFLSLLAMSPPLLVQMVIDRVIGLGERRLFVPLAVALITIPLLNALIGYLQTTSIAFVGQHFVFDLRNDLYQHLLKLSMRFYSKSSVGMLVNRTIGDTNAVQQMVTAQTIGVISDIASALFAICMTFLISWRLGLVMLIIVTIFVVNYRLNITRIRERTKSFRASFDRLSGGIQNRLSGTVAVKTFGTEEREHGEFRETLHASLGMVQDAMVTNNSFQMNTQLINQVGHSILYFLGCALVLKGDLAYGQVVAFTAYAMQLLWPAVRFSQIAKQFEDVGVSVERLLELYDEVPEIVDDPSPVAIRRLKGGVKFDHLQFWYEEGHPVIKDFSLNITPGMTVALIGPTGCGKTTILSLILRYYDACHGTLEMDGVDIRKIPLKHLRNQFGIVLQEPLLFSVSILENIRYGRPGATQEEVEAAAKVAEIHSFIETLPEGYQTQVGMEGIELSVGQRQRITIARAVLADPAILIMDEATSALDSDSERAIQLAMDRVLENRTSFIVAHRLSTIRNADTIVLLKDGYILEQGNHETLMAISGGGYRNLYEKHMGKTYLSEEDAEV